MMMRKNRGLCLMKVICLFKVMSTKLEEEEGSFKLNLNIILLIRKREREMKRKRDRI